MTRILTLLALLFCFAASAEVFYENRFVGEADLAGWALTAGAGIRGEALQLSRSAKGDGLCRLTLPGNRWSNRVLRLGCEIMAREVADKNTVSPFHGIKVQLEVKTNAKKHWFDLPLPDGSFSWKRFEHTVILPPGVESVVLNLGLQDTTGSCAFRNLRLESLGETLDFTPVANRTLEDDVAGDGQGGWTDQGPEQDGRIFREGLKKKFHGSIPVAVPAAGKSVLVMKSDRNPSGPATAELATGGTPAKTFYLLHTLAYVPKQPEPIGTVILTGENGEKQEISIQTQRDVTDWFLSVIQLPNAYPAVVAQSRDKAPAAVYLSRFAVKPELGRVVSVAFRSGPKAIWLILGATLSEQDLPLPTRERPVMKANERWLPVAYNETLRVKEGSPLDLSNLLPREKAGSSGRVIVNRDGHFAFEKRPEQPVRFFTCSLSPKDDENLRSHEAAAELAREIRKNGYNMVRLHFLDAGLMTGSKRELEFNSRLLDTLDYFIYRLKEEGIYLNIDLMASWIGYTPGHPHAPENKDSLKSFKYRIHFEPELRENWRKGVEQIFCRVNRYTGTRLIDDPVFAMAVAYNEQEYGFWLAFDGGRFRGPWLAFLKRRYGTAEKLGAAWGKPFASFDEVPDFTLKSRVYDNDDVALFLRETETATLRWYEKTMRELGYPGPVAGYNCGKNQYYNMIRKDSPYVAMNAYHAHPSNWVQPGSSISQKSAIGERAKILRDFAAIRQAGKPLMVTEHGLVFWNQYRYEQAFVMGAYAALQGFDGLTCHATPVSFRPEKRILSFGIYMDPVMKASEFLTAFLFLRGDVATAPSGLRVRISEEEVFKTNGLRGGMPTELSLAALTAGLSIECLGKEDRPAPPAAGETVVDMGETGDVLVSNAGFSSTLDNPAADAKRLFEQFRRQGVLQAKNRSDGKQRFESATGEIFLDASRNYMQIDAPRFQGICAEAGTKAELTDFTVETMSPRGLLSLVALDGMKPIREAERLILVYATNALNTNMSFTTPEMVTLHYIGDTPALLERGSFRISLRNRKGGGLRLYPLDPSGNRLKELAPVETAGDRVTFEVDTGRDGATVFFEIR